VTLVPICPSSLPSSVTFVTTASGEPRTSGAADDAESESDDDGYDDGWSPCFLAPRPGIQLLLILVAAESAAKLLQRAVNACAITL